MARKNKKEEIKRPLSGKIVLAILVISIVWGIAIMSWILPVIGLVIFIGWLAVVTADPEEPYIHPTKNQLKGFVPPADYAEDDEEFEKDFEELEKYRKFYREYKLSKTGISSLSHLSFEEYLEKYNIPKPKRDIYHLFH